MHYKAKSITALKTLIGGWPKQMRVEVDSGIGVSAKTVGDLRKVKDWPDNLSITTPPDPGSDSTIRVSKASVATRVSPKT